MLDVNGERSRTYGVVNQTSTIAEAPGRKLGQMEQSEYRLCVCCRHHDGLLTSPHYDVEALVSQ
jgi:hypothetical protein